MPLLRTLKGFLTGAGAYVFGTAAMDVARDAIKEMGTEMTHGKTRDEESAYIAHLVAAHAPHFDNRIIEWNRQGGLVPGINYTEDFIWPALKVLRKGIGAEHEDVFVEHLRRFDAYAEAGDIEGLVAEFDKYHDDHLSQRARLVRRAVREKWPEVRNAIQPSDDTVQALKAKRTDLNDRLARVKRGRRI